MKLPKIRRDEHGQGLVMVAVSLVAVFAMTGLVIDGGWLLVQRRRMQNAADAASIAAARELALGDYTGDHNSDVLARAQDYAVTRNGATTLTATYYPGGEEVGTGGVPSSATGVVITATVQFQPVFAGIFGLNLLTTRATAEARFGSANESDNLLPMAVQCDPNEIGGDPEELCPLDAYQCPADAFQYGSSYQLWGTQTGPGGFGWLDWNGTPVGNPELADAIMNPQNSGTWQLGDLVGSGPGVQNSNAVRNALDWWLAKPEDQRHVTVIAYDCTQGSGSNLKYRIAGFAEFTLTGYNFQGSNKFVQGKFQRWVKPNNNITLDDKGFGVTSVLVTK